LHSARRVFDDYILWHVSDPGTHYEVLMVGSLLTIHVCLIWIM